MDVGDDTHINSKKLTCLCRFHANTGMVVDRDCRLVIGLERLSPAVD